MTTREPETREKPTRAADPAGNERLTAMTGAALLGLAFATYHLSANWGGSGRIIP